ncbi:MAG: PIG-L family deacetylase, partial [Acidobacteria bacterium]|nr:PIG-L family deacetylase [Acidobacteriota bacterium]
GPSFTAVRLVESVISGAGSESGILDGLDTTIGGLAAHAPEVDITVELSEIGRRVEAAIANFNGRDPSSVASDLAAGMKATRLAMLKVRNQGRDTAGRDQLLFLLGIKESQFNEAMNLSLGLSLEALVDPLRPIEGTPSFFQSRETFRVATPGERFTLTASVVNRGQMPIEARALGLRTPGNWARALVAAPSGRLASKDRLRAQFEVTIPLDAIYSRPHWSRRNELRDHFYTISDQNRLHLPFSPPEVVAALEYAVDGVDFTLVHPAQTVYIDRPRGEQRRLLTIAPALNVALAPRVGVIPVATASSTLPLNVALSSNVKGPASGRLRLLLPPEWSASPVEYDFKFAGEGEAANFKFKVNVPRGKSGLDYQIRAIAEYNGREYSEGYQTITQPDLEPRPLFRPATMIVRGIDVRIAPDLKVGYVMGVGDEVPAALTQLGVRVVMLAASDLASGDLNQYDAVIVGIRATAVRDDLKSYHRRLLEYVEGGGNLIYQYQTQEFDAMPYGPWPYQLTARAEEVSEELATVTILEPSNTIFKWPNSITASDFAGWVEERGSKWMSRWDDRYTPLLESHDREQQPQRGGMLFTRYGQGTFTYAAYAFYRQLPAGVEGGYRLFANLVSLRRANK